MSFFRKRTTKTVGKEIGGSIRRQKEQEKVLRTLQREEEERKKETALRQKIREVKARRPTFFKKAGRIAKNIGTTTSKMIKTSQKKRGGKSKSQLKIGDLI